jgi:ssDNA-binding Zn-finger/Zn-ribbon topoisomerase 1
MKDSKPDLLNFLQFGHCLTCPRCRNWWSMGGQCTRDWENGVLACHYVCELCGWVIDYRYTQDDGRVRMKP